MTIILGILKVIGVLLLIVLIDIMIIIFCIAAMGLFEDLILAPGGLLYG